jgi:hypothetical protein
MGEEVFVRFEGFWERRENRCSGAEARGCGARDGTRDGTTEGVPSSVWAWGWMGRWMGCWAGRWMGMGLLLVLGAAGLGLAGQGVAAGQADVVTFDSPSSHLRQVSEEQYKADIEQLQGLVARCKAKADACDAAKAEDDVTVSEGGRSFDMRRNWLRIALGEAKGKAQGKSDAERGELMAKATARLDADLQAAEGAGTSAAGGANAAARAAADAILSRSEFRTVQEQGWLSKKWALVGLWLGMLWDSLFANLPHSELAAPLLEWLVLIAAAVGLILWAWRVTQQQRVELAVPDSDRQLVWQKEADDWARRAQVEADREAWREAVHCLYWAAIVMLEGRRFWRPNRARTPREYLALLEAGSARKRALGGLTKIFERIWYGLRPAGRRDFEEAQALLDELKAA